MDSIFKFQRRYKQYIAGLCIILMGVACTETGKAVPPPPPPAKKIKIALLLDTSNSMDGLIEQAKSQLWKIVNELASAKCEGQTPEVSIALYEYGNDNLSAMEGYIRMVTPLTSDLDQISQDLFSLRTKGGSEFCGHVIQTATDQLDWEAGNEDLKVIFIAGNEPFNQGGVDYISACKKAFGMDIFVNTIFCGPFNEGLRTYWKSGADLAHGEYMSIEQDRKTVYIPSPYDDRISALNGQLNKTYVSYGYMGATYKNKQIQQDANAQSYGDANNVSRIVSKSSKLYYNGKWDLVDAKKDKNFKLEEVEEKHLPDEMKKMMKEQRERYVDQKAQERKKIQEEIQALNAKRVAYIQEEKKKQGQSENTLDLAMITAIKSQARSKNFTFDH